MTSIGELLGATARESEIDGAVLELHGEDGTAIMAVPEEKVEPLVDAVESLKEANRRARA